LRLFSERIQQFQISFNILNFDAVDLSCAILENKLALWDIPASIRFDRIEVSNILDNNYLGINQVLTDWAPFLANGRYSTILGYFMNWAPMSQPDGMAMGAGGDVIRKLLRRLFRTYTVSIRIFWPLHLSTSHSLKYPTEMTKLSRSRNGMFVRMMSKAAPS
jgi:hypothetical protein